MQKFLVALAFLMMPLAGCIDESADATDGDPLDGDALKQTGLESVPSIAGVDYNFTGPYSKVLVPGPLGIEAPQHVVIQSDVDGVDIEMGLWLPEGEGPFPVLMFSSPYFSVDGRPVTNPGSETSSVGMLINEFVPHGFAFATHAVRGTAGSSGCNDLMGPLETADIDQAVTWLGTQSWSNGNVAMTGVSYDGSTPWGVASLGNPHLKTIIPISGVPDMHGLMYRNGSSETRGPLLLNALYIAGGVQSAPQDDLANRLICPDAYQGLALSGVAAVVGSDPTGWWQERNRKAGVEANYEGSVFSIQGLQDWNVDPSQVIPWVDELDRQGLKTKQLLGQWGHAWPDGIGTDTDDEARYMAYRADYKEILLRWLRAELMDEAVETGPAVQVRDHIGRWRDEQHFPPRDADWQMLHLRADRTLANETGPHEVIMLRPLLEQTLFDEGVPLPDSVAVDGAYADFALPHHAGELLVSGLPKLHIDVTPLGPGGYIGAYLYDRAPDGTLTRIGWTTMNLAFANGGTERQEVIPGQMINAKLEIQPMDAALLEGHQLVLRVWAATDADRLPTIPPALIQLHVGEGISSMLKLPVIERDASAYFMPPSPAVDSPMVDSEPLQN